MLEIVPVVAFLWLNLASGSSRLTEPSVRKLLFEKREDTTNSHTVYCKRNSPETISCNKNKIHCKIKMRPKEVSDDERVSEVVNAIFSGLENFKERAGSGGDRLITNPSCNSPLVVVLPNNPVCQGHTSKPPFFKPFKVCHRASHSTERTVPSDSPCLIECCPADFQPRDPYGIDPQQKCHAEYTSCGPSTTIYSCKWQSKRNVPDEGVFYVSVPLR